MGIPEDRMPEVTVLDSEFAPVVINDPKLNERVEASLRKAVGANNVDELPAVMGSEDFGRLGLDGKFPTVMFRVGVVNPAEYAKAIAIGTAMPSPHSPQFAPDPEPTLRAGILGMTQVVLDLMPR
jgi:hippurate hydrolase